MKEAVFAMQRLIDWIDEHAVENPGLVEMAGQIGYSPYYCSEQFHRIAGMTAGWTWEKGERTYFFGAGVESDYAKSIPEGFELRGEFPDSYYIVFSHPPFDYLTDNVEVMKRVEELAWNFDPTPLGYEWNEDVCQDYQRHYPEGLGYQILRPVRKIVTDTV